MTPVTIGDAMKRAANGKARMRELERIKKELGQIGYNGIFIPNGVGPIRRRGVAVTAVKQIVKSYGLNSAEIFGGDEAA